MPSALKYMVSLLQILAGPVPAPKFTQEEKEDIRICRHCGGLLREHGIYMTDQHIPDLASLDEGYEVETAFCPGFEPE